MYNIGKSMGPEWIRQWEDNMTMMTKLQGYEEARNMARSAHENHDIASEACNALSSASSSCSST